jgi:hypothetical protein
LGAQEKLGEQGYLRGQQRLQVWDPDFAKEDGTKGAYVWKNVETEGFLGPTSFYPQQIKGVSKDGFGKYSDVGVSRDGKPVEGIPQRTFDFGGVKMTEGDVISNIYARQLSDRLANEKQKEYVAKLRGGEVSIRDALLEPKTRNQYFGKDTVLISEGVPAKRRADIEKFFAERGISLDERIGTIKLGPTKFTQKQIQAAANLDPKDDLLSKEIQKSFDRYPGKFPQKYVDRLVDKNFIGQPEILDSAEYYRKTEDGKPLFADKEPGQATIQEAIFRKALYDIATGAPGDNTSVSLSQQQDQALDEFIKELPPSRNYLITFQGDDGKLSNVIIDRNNIKLQLYNLYVNGRNPQNVTPFEGDIGAGSLSKEQFDDLRKLEILSEMNKRAESDEITAAYKELVEKVGGDPTQVALTPV